MEKVLFLGNIGVWEIVLIALVVLLFFGGRKIPELMKGLGKGVKSFEFQGGDERGGERIEFPGIRDESWS